MSILDLLLFLRISSHWSKVGVTPPIFYRLNESTLIRRYSQMRRRTTVARYNKDAPARLAKPMHTNKLMEMMEKGKRRPEEALICYIDGP